MELLAVMLLIITVIAMGVPAMFAAERKSYVNQAMNEVLRVHRICMSLQRELAARGMAGQVEVNITTNASTAPRLKVTAPGNLDLAYRFGQTDPAPMGQTNDISLNVDGFIHSINATTPTAFVDSISWSYEERTGFLSGGTPINLTFNAMPSGSTFKIKRTLILYPEGYSDIP
jgi:type II secretory pathway pseudopilin PulG